MAVIRNDIDACIGCKKCVNICPMDVFYFNEEAKKSVIAYPDNCQNCGQCYLNCPADSLGFDEYTYGYGMTASR